MNARITKRLGAGIHWRKYLIGITAGIFVFADSAQGCFAGGGTIFPPAPQNDAILPAIGGGGGGFFVARCSQGQLLTGFELRTGDDVDAIRPVCVAAYGARETTTPVLTTGSGLTVIGKNFLGDIVQLEPGWFGGTGGGLRPLLCPRGEPIVTGMFVGAGQNKDAYANNTVQNIHLFYHQ